MFFFLAKKRSRMFNRNGLLRNLEPQPLYPVGPAEPRLTADSIATPSDSEKLPCLVSFLS